MRKFISVLCILVVMFFVGCSTDKPESTVSAFVEAGKEFDLVKMAETVNPSKTSTKEKIENLTQEGDDLASYFSKYFLDYFKANAQKITYTVEKSVIKGKKANVTVNFKYVDGGTLLGLSIGEVFITAMLMTFSGEEMNDEETEQTLVSAMETQQQDIDEIFVEKEIDIKLVKVDKKWYIDELSDELLDVFMSNYISVGNELNEIMDPSNDNSEEDLTFMEQVKKDNMTIIPKTKGDEIILTTLKFKINRVEEKQIITSKYGTSPTIAQDDEKFVVVNVDITNIIDLPVIIGSDDLFIVDTQERQFKAVDAGLILDDYLSFRRIAPGIKETGSFLYELPQDATGYSLVVSESGSKELYMIELK